MSAPHREQSEKGSVQLDTLIRQQTDILAALAVIEANTSLRTGGGRSGGNGQSSIGGIADEVEEDDHQGEEDTEAGCQQAVLKSLYFDGIKWREGSIQDSYEHTFDWAFTTPKVEADGKPSWSCLTDWVDFDTSEIYWITGKPGSGKSTLMKFLVSHPGVRKRLRKWASPQQLIVLAFYFWNAGQLDMQKSQEGLIRSLLYQCIGKRPDLLPLLCPRHWALFKVLGVKALRKAPKWTLQELAASFAALAKLSKHNISIALFIDGLDEFDGNHEILLDLIHRLTGNPRIKICVSSRPWNIFLDRFATSPSLRMENLTRSDIETVVRGRLGKTIGFQELLDTFPVEADALMNGIVEKARGVFLWATVVLAELCEGLQEGDRLSELNDTLEKMPHDVEDLYNSIWRRIKPRYIAQSSQLFQLHHWSSAFHRQASSFYDDVTALRYSDAILLWLTDQKDALSQDINVLRGEKHAKVCSIMKRRLNSRTRGLLEVSADGHVDFLHKSVRDWKMAKWDDICSKSESDFDPNLELLKAISVDLRYTGYVWPPRIEHCIVEFSFRASLCLFHASRIRDLEANMPAVVATLRKMDTNLAHISSKYCKMRDVQSWWFWINRKNVSSSQMARLAGSPSTFIELAAGVPILPYVRHKIQQCPEIEPSDFIKVFNSAVFGFHGLDSPVAHDFETLKARVELVRFLRDRAPIKPKDKRIRAVSKAVDEWQSLSGTRTAMEEEYWAAVGQVLREQAWGCAVVGGAGGQDSGGRKFLNSVKNLFG